MSQRIADFEKARKKRMRKNRLKRLAILFVMALAVAAFFWLKDSSLVRDLRYAADDFIHSFGSGPGFPLESPGGQTQEMGVVGSDFYLLNDTNLYVYSRQGKTVSSAQHRYTNPTAETQDGRLLLYDRGGHGLMLRTAAQTIYESNLEDTIISADVSADGTFAVVTDASGFAAKVTVYDSNQREIYAWMSADDLIQSAALFPSGGHMAIATLNAQEGMLVSQVMIFDLTQEEPVATVDYPGEMIVQVDYMENGGIAVVSDQGAYVLSGSGRQLGEYRYGRLQLAYFDTGSQGMAVVTQSQIGRQEYSMVTITDSGRVSSLQQLTHGVQSVKTERGSIYLASADAIYAYAYGQSGAAASYPVSDLEDFAPLAGNLYYQTSDTIEEIRASSSQEE